MTQPTQQPSGIAGFVTRRIGPAPIWVWFVVFVIVAVILLRWRASRAASKSSGAQAGSAANPSLIQGGAAPQYFAPDVFVNVKSQTVPGPEGPAGPTGPAGAPGPQATPGYQLNSDGTLSVGAGSHLNDIARMVGLTTPQLAALNSSFWASNTLWPSQDDPVAKSGRPYRIR